MYPILVTCAEWHIAVSDTFFAGTVAIFSARPSYRARPHVRCASDEPEPTIPLPVQVHLLGMQRDVHRVHERHARNQRAVAREVEMGVEE